MVAVLKEALPNRVTPEEYFEIDAASNERLEYENGVIFDMAGTSLQHNEIAGNIFSEIKAQFRGRFCKVYMESVRVRVSETTYRYPDVIALCGAANTLETRPETLINPNVIFEVLSPSTQGKDRGEKFDEYAQIATLSDYVLVAQDAMRVRHYRRTQADHWEIATYLRVEDVLELTSLKVSLTLADIYAGISLNDVAPTENSLE